MMVLSFAFISSLKTHGQNINIPDPIFKSILVNNPSINTNQDGEIQEFEAQVYTGSIFVDAAGITDLTGINTFASLTELSCYGNELTNLNVHYCTAITTLNCSGNHLTSLALPGSTSLVSLNCHSNQLTGLELNSYVNLQTLNCRNNSLTNLSLPISLVNLICDYNQLTSLSFYGNMSLKTLSCNNNQLTSLFLGNTPLNNLNCSVNQLTSLDLSDLNGSSIIISCSQNQLTSLLLGTASITSLICSVNKLTDLDISGTPATALDCSQNQLLSLNAQNGMNYSFASFYSTSNPNLQCIQVDDPTWSSTYWTHIDNGTFFSDNCLTGLQDKQASRDVSVTVYPNPGQGIFTIASEHNFSTLKLFNSFGQLVLSNETIPEITTIDLSHHSQGIYNLILSDEKGFTYSRKIVIE